MTFVSLEEKAALLYSGEALAPMVRASTTPLRTLALKYGADFCFTEELIDRSLSKTHRVENTSLQCIDYIKDDAEVSKRSRKRLERDGDTALILRIDPKLESGKLVCQLGTGEPELALEAALRVHQDVSAIDINMGCPKKFSVSGGMGSALLSDPDRACRIIRCLTENLSEKGIPISAKIRLLRDTASTLDFVGALVGAGAKAISIHGRRVGDESTTPADWDSLRQVASLAKPKHGIPILLNGDFYTRDEFTSWRQSTGADGVLLARPALYNMSIFRKPSKGDTSMHGYDSPLLLDKTSVVQDYLREAVRYGYNHKNVKYVVCEFMTNRRAPSVRVPYLKQCYPGGQTINKVCACHSIPEICKLWAVDWKFIRQSQSEAEEALPAGEHKYLDSYFLGPSNQSKHEQQELAPDATSADDESEQLAKRIRPNK